MIIALAGNPNCGKTVIFNALTGSRQRVGNWPGVTVGKKTGKLLYKEQEAKVVDLPGIYSNSVVDEGAIDEKIACEYLLSGKADVIVNVVDASNLERHLYLTLQLMEMNIPVILAVNMMDMLKSRALKLDLKKLSKELGCPVVPLVAREGKGIEELKKAVFQEVPPPRQSSAIFFEKGSEVLSAVSALASHIEGKNPTWIAQRLLENDHFAKQQVNESIYQLAQEKIQQLTKELGEEPDLLIADQRYSAITDIIKQIYTLYKTPRQTMTQWIDRVVLNRYLGVPIFLFIMYLMFVFAINVGGAFQDFFDIGSSVIFVHGLAHLMQLWHMPTWSIAVLASGLGMGINTVVTFIPVLGAMFIFLAFLEDSGYMARAAFVMDRLMRALGLPGKSFVPMIVGFGCNVPAVMGARTLSNRRDRVLTIMMMPFMSCGARLAIFTVFASAFFKHHGAGIIFLLYLTGILVAILTGYLLRKTILKGKPAPLIMELPAYHVPKLTSLMRHSWGRLKHFLMRASKVIIPVCVVIGVLNSVTLTGGLVQNGSSNSLLSATGRVVTPFFSPMGVQKNNWPATVGLATGVLAKEVVIGTLNSLYSDAAHLKLQNQNYSLLAGLKAAVMSVPEDLRGLGSALINPIIADEAPHAMNKTAYGLMHQRFGSKIAAFCYLLFVLLYFPCISTMAAIRREVNRRWAYFSVAWCTGVAYTMSVICYQLLTISMHPLTSLGWIGAMMTVLGLTIGYLIYYAKSTEMNEAVARISA